MKSVALMGAAALAMVFGSGVAHAAGGGGGHICYDENGEVTECPAQDPGDTGGGTPSSPGSGSSGAPSGSGTGTPSPTATITFNALTKFQPFTSLTEGDYVISLVRGSIVNGFGAYNTTGLDTVGPLAAAYDPNAPIPQFSIKRTDGGLFTLDSFFTARLSGNGVNTTTVQGYVDGVLSGTSTVVSSFDGFGNPEPSLLAGAFDSVIFTLDTTSSGVSIDNISVTSAAVPEPASWAMMVIGFGVVGGALRSRRKAAVSFG